MACFSLNTFLVHPGFLTDDCRDSSELGHTFKHPALFSESLVGLQPGARDTRTDGRRRGEATLRILIPSDHRALGEPILGSLHHEYRLEGLRRAPLRHTQDSNDPDVPRSAHRAARRSRPCHYCGYWIEECEHWILLPEEGQLLRPGSATVRTSLPRAINNLTDQTRARESGDIDWAEGRRAAESARSANESLPPAFSGQGRSRGRRSLAYHARRDSFLHL